jgi:hypothetical protein
VGPQLFVAAAAILHRARESRLRVATANRRAIEGAQDPIGHCGGHFDEGERIVNIDVTDRITGNVGFVGHRAHQVGRTNFVAPAHPQEYAHHPRFAPISIFLCIAPGRRTLVSTRWPLRALRAPLAARSVAVFLKTARLVLPARGESLRRRTWRGGR